MVISIPATLCSLSGLDTTKWTSLRCYREISPQPLKRSFARLIARKPLVCDLDPVISFETTVMRFGSAKHDNPNHKASQNGHESTGIEQNGVAPEC